MLACASGEQFACWPVSYGDNLHADLRNKGHIGTADEKLDPWVRTGGSHARRGDGRAVPARPRGGDGVRRGGRVRRGRPPRTAERWAAGLLPHSDRGGHYRWPGWVALCRGNRLVRSMSRKGRSCDNARMEGFFGTLKSEFFHSRDWEGVDRT